MTLSWVHTGCRWVGALGRKFGTNTRLQTAVGFSGTDISLVFFGRMVNSSLLFYQGFPSAGIMENKI